MVSRFARAETNPVALCEQDCEEACGDDHQRRRHDLSAERRRLLADIRPLRESPEYRRLWIGQSMSAVGNQMTNVAVPVQVYA